MPTSRRTTGVHTIKLDKVGSLKNERKVFLTKKLPATVDKSIYFVTIGYHMEAFVDDKVIYTFGPL